MLDYGILPPAVSRRMMLGWLGARVLPAERRADRYDTRARIHVPRAPLARDELLGELDKLRDQLGQEIHDDLAEKILTLQDERNQARSERDRAEGLLVALIQQLLPGEKPVYLYSAGIRELDRVALNQTPRVGRDICTTQIRHHKAVRSNRT